MLIEKKVNEFIMDVASDSPAPGGGSVAALSAAAGAGLISMLANLTKTKKGYEEVHEKMAEIAEICTKEAAAFLCIIDEDTRAFDKYMDAIRMPKDTEEEKAARSQAMQRAAEGATNVPLKLARQAFKLTDLAEYVIKHGNKNATSDGAVAMLMLRSGILGAIYNVRINLGSIKNQEFVDKVKAEADKLEDDIKRIEIQALEKVQL